MPRRPSFAPYPKHLEGHAKELGEAVSELIATRRELLLIRKYVEKRGLEARAEGNHLYEARAEIILHVIDKMTGELQKLEAELTDQRGDLRNLGSLLRELDTL